MMLSGGEFATFKQIKEAGGKVNKGAKGERVAFYKKYSKTEINEETGEEQIINHKVLKAYTVFSIADTDLEQKHDKKQPVHKWDAIEKAEEIAADYCKRNGVKVEHGSNRAYQQDSIFGKKVVMPRKEQFDKPEEYYSTLFHELTHSTADAVNRDKSKYSVDKKARAREELVAEIGAAYILSYLGIESEFSGNNSAAYVKSWCQALKDDKAAIMFAAPKAIEAANYIMNIAPEA